MGETLLCNLSDTNQVIDDFKTEWTTKLLLKLGVDASIMSGPIQDFRYHMEEKGLEVELKSSGEVNIYKKVWHEDTNPEMCGWLPPTQNHLIAQWKEPTRTKRVDGKEVYYEVELNYWSMIKIDE